MSINRGRTIFSLLPMENMQQFKEHIFYFFFIFYFLKSIYFKSILQKYRKAALKCLLNHSFPLNANFNVYMLGKCH